MSDFLSRIPKWARWFSLGIILVLVGGSLLLSSFLSTPHPAPASGQQVISESSTAAALTLSAEQVSLTAAFPTQPNNSMSPTPSPTNFPVFGFTQPATQPPVATTGGSAGCNSSIYISDVTIPDGTALAPGANFVKTWMFENTGSCTWNTNYQLIFITGDQMGGTATKLGSSVAPNQQVQASVSLTAPSAEGNYKGYWQLADNQGNLFGGQVTVVIVVSGSTETPTSTTTATGAIPTSTLTPAGTILPTSTQTAAVSTPATAAPSKTVTPSNTPTTTSTASATNMIVPTLTSTADATP